VQVRHREYFALKKLAQHLPLKISNPGSYSDYSTKTNVLLQSHFSRVPLTAAVAADQAALLPDATRLLRAMLDVISSNSWLAPAMATMELAQMVVQGLWNTDSPLLQLPHVDKALASKLNKAGVQSIPDLMDLEDQDRNTLLAGLGNKKLQDIAKACNSYPDIELKFQVQDADSVHAKGAVVVSVTIERDPEEDVEEDEVEGVPQASAPRYPQALAEGWWLCVGDPQKNKLLSMKRVAMKKKQTQV
jgi:pre-mRNA-splicing helicase BRR2